MKNKAVKASTHVFNKQNPIHLDANILVFLHPPLGQIKPQARVYAPVIKGALSQGVPLRISVLVVSEYINTYARLVYNSLFKSKYANFKTFRSSSDWKPYAEQIEGEMQSILSYCDVVHALSDNPDTIQHMAEFAGGSFDYNDQLIVRGCQLDSAGLLTDDGDMTSGGIEVITENEKLLLKCP